MRFSTIVFLGLFGLLFARMTHFSPLSCTLRIDRREARECPEQRSDQLTRTIEAALDSVQRTFRDTDLATRKLERSVRSLQDLVKSAEHDLDRARRFGLHPEAVAIRQQSCTELGKELDEVVRGHHKLLAIRAQLQGECATLEAKLELARAGLLRVAMPRTDRPDQRLSPLEALGITPSFDVAY